MVRRQGHELVTARVEERVAGHRECWKVPSCDGVERGADLLVGARPQNIDLQFERARGFLHVFHLTFRRWKLWVHQDADRCRPRHELAQQPEPLRLQVVGQATDASGVSSRPAEARREPLLDRIATDCEDDRNSRGGGLGRRRGWLAAGGRQDAHRTVYDLRRHSRQPIISALRPPILDDDVLTFIRSRSHRAPEETPPQDAQCPRVIWR
jgi:hypothetical protein